MSELLFVDACVRGERSRTLALARHFLAAYEKSHPEVRVTERNLMEERLELHAPSGQGTDTAPARRGESNRNAKRRGWLPAFSVFSDRSCSDGRE